MPRIWTVPTLALGLLSLSGAARPSAPGAATECDVAALLQAVDVPPGAVAITALGEAEEITTVLVPAAKQKPGSYDVYVRRKAKDIYQVQGMSLYVRTRYCFEYTYGDRATLRFNGYGGKLIFDQ